jgi:hypothetical protein
MRELWGANKEQRLAYRWFPKGSMAIQHPDGLGVAYVSQYDTKGRWQVVTYRGSAGKHSANALYSTLDKAELAVADWFNTLTSHKEYVAKSKAERNQAHTLVVGDIITNSWGYDQTNVDCYQVTRVSSHFVWLRPIAQELVPDEGCGPMSGRVKPIPGRFLENGEETQHKASSSAQYGNSVCFKYGSGSKWDGRSLYCSWYA